MGELRLVDGCSGFRQAVDVLERCSPNDEIRRPVLNDKVDDVALRGIAGQGTIAVCKRGLRSKGLVAPRQYAAAQQSRP